MHCDYLSELTDKGGFLGDRGIFFYLFVVFKHKDVAKQLLNFGLLTLVYNIS